ncbi:pre-peptidase C-terminal domain-containing protein [Sphingomonas sp.]|uniref:pre-peptidase C-terminal domain-containing protein n=1 Tax=Sphingomonas sp. TaxID=28214 RepID=UPI0035BC8327
MYIDTYALGEAKADDLILACGCPLCMGKSAIARDRVYDMPTTTLGTIASAIPATIQNASDTRFTGTLTPGETQDVFGLSVVAGQTYSVALRGVGANGIDDPLLALFDQTGTFINADDDGGAGITSLLTFTATATGTYFLTAQTFGAGDVGDYTIDVWQQRATDQVPDTFAGAVAIGVGTTFGHIETSNDVDTYKVVLEAGKLYTFELAGGADYDTDPLNVPQGELDTILGLYAPDGTFIGFNDDIAYPTNIGSGFSFVPTVSGTYYLDVIAYPDQTGGYTLDVTAVDPADFDPLDSINWRNADNIPTVDVAGVPTAYVYFGDSDQNFGQTGDDGGPMVTIDWNAFEKQQVMVALEEYTRILGVNYVVTTDEAQATFRLLKTESAQYGAYFFPQDPAYGDAQGVGVFNVLSGGWSFDDQQSLEKGGYSFAVMLHEFGHAHGLAHPHDNGGGSDIMLGVTAATGSYGLFNLNQGVYTVMSYNDAWDFHPDGPTPYTGANIDSGWSGTLGAFDIAELQLRYGVTPREGGNTVYRLGDANDQGTYYQTIWDTGGTDEIRYDGARAAQIDLLAATLDYSPTGGGVVSFVDDIFGGYTIANGVTIENATGGSGNDVLLGNAVGNVLKGNAGNDTLMGRGGDDTLIGGLGNDTLNGGDGADTADYADGPQGVTANLARGTVTGAMGTDTLTSIENVRGSRGDDTLTGDAGANRLKGETGNDRIDGGAGDDQLFGDAGDDTLTGGLGNDTIAGGAGVDTADFYGAARAVTVNLSITRAQDTGVGLDTINTVENLRGSTFGDRLTGDAGANQLKGEAGDDFLFGLGGADTLFGDAGNDTLNGGTGYDVLAGGAGVDRFVFDSLDGDLIKDWTSGEKIDVSAFAGAAVNIVAGSGKATVSFDIDGDGQFDDGFFVVTTGAQAFGTSDLILM